MTRIVRTVRHLTPFEHRAFAAAAAAHERTGAPVCVHTELGTMGLRIVERLRSRADLRGEPGARLRVRASVAEPASVNGYRSCSPSRCRRTSSSIPR